MRVSNDLGQQAIRENASLLRQLDAALAVIGTMSARLTAALSKARMVPGLLEQTSHWADIANERAIALADRSVFPDAQLDSSLEGFDVENAALVDVVVDFVEQRVGLGLRHPEGQRRIWLKLAPDRGLVNPEVDALSLLPGTVRACQHEASLEVGKDERYVHVRLVAQENRAVAHLDPAAVLCHDVPSDSGGNHATPAVDGAEGVA